MNLIGKAAITTAFIAFGAVAAFGLPPYTGNTSGTDSAAILSTLTDTYSLLSSGSSVGGAVASGSSDIGNPVKIGGVYNSTPPTVTTGQRVDAQLTSHGSVRSMVTGFGGTTSTPISNTVRFSAADATDAAGGTLAVLPYLYNGSAQDVPFTCASQASVSVTAGNTTQIIALSGSTVIRICSVSLGISANGTVALTSGTGTNCGTPANAMAAINLNTGTMWQQSAPAGGSLYRGSAGGEFCITAATGNVTGFVTYAQY